MNVGVLVVGGAILLLFTILIYIGRIKHHKKLVGETDTEMIKRAIKQLEEVGWEIGEDRRNGGGP